MQNRSSFPVELQSKGLNPLFAAEALTYTQRYSPHNLLHHHDCLEIGRCIEGSGVLFVDGDVFSFSAGSVSVIRKGCIHDSHVIMTSPSDTPSRWEYIFADPEKLALSDPGSRSFITADADFGSLFGMMFRELTDHPVGWQAQFGTLLTAFLTLTRRHEESRRALPSRAMPNEITRILHIIAHEYAGKLTVSALAERCALSTSRFRCLFRDHVGISPQQYVIHVRLSMAEHLLRTTTLPILDISEETGFSTLSSFNRHFLKTYGCSPREFRRGNG